ncbi:hypothetical protein EPA93_16670 [Ktedonosporobacter rubrisoli]|uniref:Asl1-like glycosyl hydrolase catalytic domain-containing protein n=1 Tax=Ktedonosporobacter rubrisoli TaxID=2509675 RepID=A0A4P6JQD6_KTERU|nr:hypothetical protein [Ktedonosporobacter rubrisoli]QBD77535.1 hypothetical protein EPA93_16670 [Ktedonosporobacter rubrisoli]
MDKESWQQPRIRSRFPRWSLKTGTYLIVLLLTVMSWGVWEVKAADDPHSDHPVSQVSTEEGEHRKTNSIPPPLSMPSQISPLIFGTDLELTSATDPFLKDPNISYLINQMHMRLVRMPTRIGTNTEPQIPIETEMEAARQIRSMSAIPLVNLRGPADPDVLKDDLLMIKGLNQIFGESPVYYELGNESDLGGFDKIAYTNKWNEVIVQLRAQALNGKFIGPVNFQYNDDYLRYFLQHANPLPDAVSWHEYTCDTSGIYTKPPDPPSTCLEKLDRWNIHFNDARIAMHDILGEGEEVPIIISEYNYDPHIPAFNEDAQFIIDWTSKAIETLAKNNIFAAVQHSVMSLTPLINNGQLTIQATVLKSKYEELLQEGGGFSFEDGQTAGWKSDSDKTTLQVSTAVAWDGIHALQVTLADQDVQSSIEVSGSAIATLNGRSNVLAHVYAPAGSSLMIAQLFVEDEATGSLCFGQPIVLKAETWNLLRFGFPFMPVTSGKVRTLGIRFFKQASPSTIYVDGISWT